MNVSRSFLVMAVVYLLIGMVMGMYMGGSGDHTLAPVHAHINLLGFALMALFALIYRLFDGLAGGRLASLHFWLHQVGTALMLLVLFLMVADIVAESVAGPVMPVSELLVFVGTLAFGWNVLQNAK
ncbi:MAG: cytochrome-c oxidase [Rhodobacteraceae bacterium]|nr:cytochrome-c oxidase [Paracoccaceae bacterium]